MSVEESKDGSTSKPKGEPASIYTGQPSSMNEGVQKTEVATLPAVDPGREPSPTPQMATTYDELAHGFEKPGLTAHQLDRMLQQNAVFMRDPETGVYKVEFMEVEPEDKKPSAVEDLVPLKDRIVPKDDKSGHVALKPDGQPFATTPLNPTAVAYKPTDQQSVASIATDVLSVQMSETGSEGFQTVVSKSSKKKKKKKKKKKGSAQPQGVLGSALQGVCDAVSPPAYHHHPSSSSSGDSSSLSTAADPNLFSPQSVVSRHDPDEDYIPTPDTDFRKGKDE